MPTAQEYGQYAETAKGVLDSLFGGDAKPEEQQRMESYASEVKPQALVEARSTGLTVYAGWYGMIIGCSPTGSVGVAGRYTSIDQVDPMLANIAYRAGQNVIAVESLDPWQTHVVYASAGGDVVVPGGSSVGGGAGPSSSWLLIGAAALGAWLIFKRR